MAEKDIVSETDIKHLVDEFYTQVIADPVIGYIFTDVISLSWEKHIPVMYSFWNSILLGAGSYSGNAMIKHVELNKQVTLTKDHFERWLQLWENTVNANYKGNKADEAISRAKNIAALIQHKVAQSMQL